MYAKENTRISLSKFRTIVTNDWLAKQDFPIEITKGAGNAKRTVYLFTLAPLEPPLKIKDHVKHKILGTSPNGSPDRC